MKKFFSVFPFFFVFSVVPYKSYKSSLHTSRLTFFPSPSGGAGGGLLLSLHVELVGSEADNGETVGDKNDGSILEVGIDILQKTVLRLNVER